MDKELIKYISVYINDEYLENYLDDPDDLIVNVKEIITNAVEAYEGGAR